MSRTNIYNAISSLSYKVYLNRVRINQGGYDDMGRYWGNGQPLYRLYADTPDDARLKPGDIHIGSDAFIEDYLRAYDRNDAKEQILKDYPNATFFR